MKSLRHILIITAAAIALLLLLCFVFDLGRTIHTGSAYAAPPRISAGTGAVSGAGSGESTGTVRQQAHAEKHIPLPLYDSAASRRPSQAEINAAEALAAKHGWPELPQIESCGDLIYFAHDKLPSSPEKRNYSFCFSARHNASLWVAYPMHVCYTGEAGRNDKFCFDSEFAAMTGDTDIQANVSGAYYSEYGNTQVSDTNLQYSRGHQLPSADRTASSEDNRTTFYATNMTPQRQQLNGGAWEKLESLVRKQWTCSDTLYVVSGAIFADTLRHAYDNRSRGKMVSVPSHYYKALLRTRCGDSGKCISDCAADEIQCIAFIIGHDDSRSKKCVFKSDACSVAQLEQVTGITFFANVPQVSKELFDTALWPGLQ